MKKVLLCVVVVFVFVLSSVSAKSIQVNIDNEDVKVNDSIILSFTFDEVKQLKGLQFDILYDAESLVLNGTEKGEAFDDALVGGMSTDKNGTIKVVIAYASELDFSGEICSAEFKVLDGKKNAYVKVSNVKVASNEDVTFEETEKQIVIVDATEAEGDDAEELPDDDNGGGSGSNSGNSGSTSGSSGSSSGSSGSANVSDKENSSKDDSSTSKNDGGKETLFVDSDASSMNEDKVPEKVFVDTVGHWAEINIQNMAGLGIVNGVSDTEFQPDRSVTRAEFATMVSKVLGLDKTSENIYSDVDEDAWYKDVVLKCTKAGLIQGAEDLFRPDDLISREEMAVILYRTMKYIGSESNEPISETVEFSDAEEISDWAVEAVKCMAQNGIINGMGNNMFAPQDSATRAQAVVVLEKIMKYL